MAYTADELELIRKSWLDDGLSAGQIARLIGGGRSRNAVIGICHRNGWLRPNTTKQRPHHLRSVSYKPKPRPAPVPVEDIRSGRVVMEPYGPIGDFPAAGLCRYMANDPRDRTEDNGPAFQCCGWPTGLRDKPDNQEGNPLIPYCHHHHVLTHHVPYTYNPDRPVGNPEWRLRSAKHNEDANELFPNTASIAAE